MKVNSQIHIHSTYEQSPLISQLHLRCPCNICTLKTRSGNFYVASHFRPAPNGTQCYKGKSGHTWVSKGYLYDKHQDTHTQCLGALQRSLFISCPPALFPGFLGATCLANYLLSCNELPTAKHTHTHSQRIHMNYFLNAHTNANVNSLFLTHWEGGADPYLIALLWFTVV